jgi:hypothetical protein
VRIARADCSLVEYLDRVVTVLKRREGFGRISIAARSHPQHATWVPQT